jgi:hypothetical protein
MARTIAQQPASTTGNKVNMLFWWRTHMAHRILPPLLLLLAVGLRAFLIGHGWPVLQSDEALLALMGRHILLDREHPLFFWGQSYLVPIESYLFAGAFAIFGVSTLVFRATLLALTTIFLWLIYQLGRAIYGWSTGLLTLAYLALGPFWALFGEVRARGAYLEDMTLGAALFLLVLRRVHASMTRRAWLDYVLMGLLAGVGFLIHPIMLVFMLPALVVLAATRRRELLGWPGLGALAAILISCLPLLVYNIEYPAATLVQIWQQNGSGSHTTSLRATLAHSWQATLTTGLPIVVSGPEKCQSLVVPAWASWLRSNCGTINALIVAGGTLLVISMVAMLLWQAGHYRQAAKLFPLPSRWSTFPPTTGQGVRSVPDPWGEALLAGLVLATVIPYCLSKSAYLDADTAPRYLLPLYVAAPLFIGRLWGWTSNLTLHYRSGKGPFRFRSRRQKGSGGGIGAGVKWWQGCRVIGSAGAAAMLLVVLSWNLFGYLQTVQNVLAHPHIYANPMPVEDARLITYLEGHHLTRIYSDYWVGWRLMFLSNERILSANISPNLHPFYNRYPPYAAAVQATPHPAYVLLAGTAGAAEFDRLAAQAHLPHIGYTRLATFGNYLVYGYAPEP